MKRHIMLHTVHSCNHHPNDLTSNHIISNPEAHLPKIQHIRQKPQEVVIHLENVASMLP